MHSAEYMKCCVRLRGAKYETQRACKKGEPKWQGFNDMRDRDRLYSYFWRRDRREGLVFASALYMYTIFYYYYYPLYFGIAEASFSRCVIYVNNRFVMLRS